MYLENKKICDKNGLTGIVLRNIVFFEHKRHTISSKMHLNIKNATHLCNVTVCTSNETTLHI